MYIKGDIVKSNEYEKINWHDDFCKDILNGIDIVVVDSYYAQKSFYVWIAEQVKTCVWLDDNNRIPYPCGLILSNNVILRKPFWQTKEKCGNKIFISLGGTSNYTILQDIIFYVKQEYKNKKLIVFSPIKPDNLSADDKWLFNVGDNEIATCMLECEMAISAGGQTLLELLSIGVPTVAVIIADNQEQNVKTKMNNIIGLVNIKDKEFAQKAVKLLENKNFTPLFCETKDIANKILMQAKIHNLINSYELDAFKLKSFANLTKEESRLVLKWRNNNAIRKWMINTDEIDEKEHFDFLNNRKASKNSFYWLVSLGQDYIGVVSLSQIDIEKKQCFSGIYVNPDIQSNGFGAKLLKILLNVASSAGLKSIFAQIASKNIASVKIHEKCNFIKKDFVKNFFANDDMVLFESNLEAKD